MNRLLLAAVLFPVLAQAQLANAAESQECGPAVFAALGRALEVAHFVPGPYDFGKDAAGVVVVSVCRRMPDDPKLTLAAVGWNAGRESSKALVVAIVDEGAATVVASQREDIDEDETTRLNALRLDTAPYTLAPGVRAFGVDVYSDNPGCGDGGLGPSRTLYVRDGKTLRPVLQSVFISEYRYLRGNQPRCIGPGESQETISETYAVTIGLGAPGKDGWKDLLLTVTPSRDDHRPSTLKPLRVRVPYDGNGYSLKPFDAAYVKWRR